MSKIVIDARISGTSTGRYVDKLIEHLYNLKPADEVIVLTKSPRIKFIKNIAPDFEVIASDFEEFSFAEQLAFKKQLMALKPDLVHFTMTQQPVLYKGNHVTTIHDLTTIRFSNPAKNKIVFYIKQNIYKWVAVKVAKNSSYIITPSKFVKDDLINYSKIKASKVFVTHEAADKITGPGIVFKKLINRRFILYLGRPTPHKNLARLILAFDKVRQSQPDLYLVLAGKKDVNYRLIESKIPEDLRPHVLFTNFISDGQLKWLYQNCRAYVFPSLSEGFGLPGLEAMASGAPVISSNATCLPEIYGDAAEYFNPKDVDDMAKKIISLINDEKLREKLIIKGRERAKLYSWQKTAEETMAVYQKALSSSR